jgi:hypothetical protein
MQVTGINGQSGAVIGLVDSGADTTSFPLGYASLMGYSAATLTQQPSVGVAGATNSYLATVPCSMFVVGLPAVVIPITPTFVPGSQLVLWGRQDFMARFDVTVMEKQQQFSITPC